MDRLEIKERILSVSKPLNIVHDILEKYRVDENTQADEPQCILSLGPHSNTFTLGNISTIIGHAKSRKSYFVSYVVREYLKQNEGRVLWIDTEQSKYYVKRSFNRVAQYYQRVDIVALRPVKTSERREYTKALIEAGNYELVIIDGLRDLIKSINDEEVATDTADLLLTLSANQNCHIISVLHMNKKKEDRNPRGHIGTEMMNKSETVISVTKEQGAEFSVIEAEQIRSLDFTPFELLINEDDLPERGADVESQKQEYVNLDDMNEEWFSKLRDIVWQGAGGEMKPSELKEAVYNNSAGVTRKDTQTVIDVWVNKKWIYLNAKSPRDPHKKYILVANGT